MFFFWNIRRSLRIGPWRVSNADKAVRRLRGILYCVRCPQRKAAYFEWQKFAVNWSKVNWTLFSPRVCRDALTLTVVINATARRPTSVSTVSTSSAPRRPWTPASTGVAWWMRRQPTGFGATVPLDLSVIDTEQSHEWSHNKNLSINSSKNSFGILQKIFFIKKSGILIFLN